MHFIICFTRKENVWKIIRIFLLKIIKHYFSFFYEIVINLLLITNLSIKFFLKNFILEKKKIFRDFVIGENKEKVF